MGEGIEVIRKKIISVRPREHKLFSFLEYLKHQWLPIAKIVSVFRRPYATNNICELHNHLFLAKVGKHPPLWQFLGKNCNNTFRVQKTIKSLF